MMLSNRNFSIFFFFFFFAVLGFELRALCLLGQGCATWATLPAALSALVTFEIEFHFYAWAGLNHNPPIYASCVTGVTDTCHHAHLLLVEKGSWELRPRLGSNHDPPDICLPSSYDYRVWATQLGQFHYNLTGPRWNVPFYWPIHHYTAHNCGHYFNERWGTVSQRSFHLQFLYD
jgi:hypothetical protein